MKRLLAALALATALVAGPLVGPASGNAKANLATVSNTTPKPAVVAPAGQGLPQSSTVVLFREIPKQGRKASPPRVITDVIVETRRAEKREAAKLAAAKKEKPATKRSTPPAKKKTSTKKQSTSRVSSSPARAATGKSSSRNWATPGQCTWGALEKWRGATGWYLGGFYGNAKDWASRAAGAGHTVSSTPRARSVVVMQPGVHGSSSSGHVAWVTGVSNGKISVVEMNALNGPYNWNTRTLTHQGGMRYIYAP